MTGYCKTCTREYRLASSGWGLECSRCIYRRKRPKMLADAARRRARLGPAEIKRRNAEATRKRVEAKATRARPATCEVCGNPSKGGYAIAWDHNHATGEFRGWLCHSCNAALGQAGDNPQILRALASYLDKAGHGCRRAIIR